MMLLILMIDIMITTIYVNIVADSSHTLSHAATITPLPDYACITLRYYYAITPLLILSRYIAFDTFDGQYYCYADITPIRRHGRDGRQGRRRACGGAP